MLACALGALALGGIHKEAIFACAALSLVALMLSAWRSDSLAMPPLGWVALLVWLATALQLVPLPFAVVEALSPRTAATWAAGAAAMGDAAPAWIPLTLDPQSTGLMLVWTTAALAAFFAASRLASKPRHHLNWVVLMVPATGLVVLFIGLAHAVFGLEALFGVFRPGPGAVPKLTGALYFSTFMNPNHLAAFLNLGFLCALGYAVVDDLRADRRVLWGITAAALAVGVVLTASRGGILVGVLGAMVLMMSHRAKPIHLVMLVTVLILALVASMSSVGDELSTFTDSRTLLDESDRDTLVLGAAATQAFPLTGVGRGAFGVGHTQLNDGITAFTVTHAHNTPLQVVVDYGWPLGGTLVLLLVFFGVKAFTHAFKVPLTRAAAVALAAVGIHNLVDFNLDLLGIGLAASILLGACAPRSRRYVPWRPVVAGCAAALIGLAVAWPFVGPEAGPRRDAWIKANPVEATQRYPADAYAWLAAGAHERNATWLRHARVLHPSEPNISLALAHLADAPEWQGWTREAMSKPWAYQNLHQMFSLVRRRARTGNEVLDALPPQGSVVARYIRWTPERHEPILRRALERFGSDPHVLEAIAMIRLLQSRNDEADDLGTRLMIDGHAVGYRIVGEVSYRRGRWRDAHHLFLEAGDPESLLKAADAALRMNQPERALDVLANAKVGPKQLKRLKTLRERARALINSP